MPNQVYKFNGTNWIQVDKHLSDSYTYDEAYIDYLIEKIAEGIYDAELLSDSEREQVAIRLQQTKQWKITNQSIPVVFVASTKT